MCVDAGRTTVRYETHYTSCVSQACMGGDIPALLTIGNPSVNQAVKGIAAAAQDMKAHGDLTFQPAFRHQNRTKPLIAFYLARQRIVDRIDNGEEVELTSTANQKIVSLAGAIAGKVGVLACLHGCMHGCMHGFPHQSMSEWPAHMSQRPLSSSKARMLQVLHVCWGTSDRHRDCMHVFKQGRAACTLHVSMLRHAIRIGEANDKVDTACKSE